MVGVPPGASRRLRDGRLEDRIGQHGQVQAVGKRLVRLAFQRIQRVQQRPEGGLFLARMLDVVVEFGHQGRHQARLPEQLEGLRGRAEGEEPEDLLQHARGGGLGDLGMVGADRAVGLLLDGHVEPRGQAHGAHHADGILAEPDVGVADHAQQPLVQVAQAVDVVDDVEGLDVVEEPVDREVAPPRILLRGAEGVVAALVERPGRALVRHLDRVVGLPAEGAGLDDLVAEDHMRQPEAPADEEAVAEEPADLAWLGVGAHVEILRLAAQQQVADAAADEIGLEPGLVQAVEHLQRFRSDLLA